MAIATITRPVTTINDGFGAYNDTVTGILVEHTAAGTHGVVTATTVNALTLTAATTGFTIAGGTTSKTLTLDANLTASALADITAAEADQIEAIGTTTISAAQWGYLGACGAGGGQLLAALTAAESSQIEAIGTTTISAAQWGYLGACGAGGGQLLAALTTGESTQLEAIGATTISAVQWAHLGGFDTTARARAYLSTAQLNLADVTVIKVLLDGESYDPGSNFAAYKFTCPTTGYYAIQWNVGFVNIIANKNYTAMLYLNGAAAIFNSVHSSDDTNELRFGGSDIQYLTATNYLELYVYLNVGAATVDLENDPRMTYLVVSFLGA